MRAWPTRRDLSCRSRVSADARVTWSEKFCKVWTQLRRRDASLGDKGEQQVVGDFLKTCFDAGNRSFGGADPHCQGVLAHLRLMPETEGADWVD